jgi:hypothetical protein
VAGRADEYRRRAQECLEIAPTFNNYQSRNILLQMAQVWLRLADNYEDAEMAGRAKVAAEELPCRQTPTTRRSFRLDVRRLDDRPPLFDFGFVVGSQRLRRLLFTRRNLLTQIS